MTMKQWLFLPLFSLSTCILRCVSILPAFNVTVLLCLGSIILLPGTLLYGKG